MEDVVDLDAEPYASPYPLVCFEDSPYQLVSAVRQPLPAAPGAPVRYDDEYRREGTCNLCMCFEPLQGWRPVKITDRGTAPDCAYGMEALVAIHVPQATAIRVVLANLTTHTPAARYATFPPAEAYRILRQLACHYPPKHGSGLHMAESEFAVVAAQCLDRRLGNQEMVRRAITAWETRRNAAKATADWRLTTTKARRKRKHIYP
jgi:DDE superfamily endonuclease